MITVPGQHHQISTSDVSFRNGSTGISNCKMAGKGLVALYACMCVLIVSRGYLVFSKQQSDLSGMFGWTEKESVAVSLLCQQEGLRSNMVDILKLHYVAILIRNYAGFDCSYVFKYFRETPIANCSNKIIAQNLPMIGYCRASGPSTKQIWRKLTQYALHTTC